MNRLPIIAFAILLLAITSCGSDDIYEEYTNWRNANVEWYDAQAALLDENGNSFYTTLRPTWYAGSGVLIHYFNDRNSTLGNLSPLITSTVDVKYIGRLYDDTVFDSSYTNTTYGDSIYRCLVSDNINGWQVALLNMRVGDSVRVVIPYDQAYGSSSTGSILPYSMLQFDIKLVDIYRYELPNS
ncbi:MAG: FKBP-type peptidyl-prolyl cis-trans isomerase [Bacteroidales bacterium]|nr:FKBP-type peptidyl-prolyl cis-trans isomerase [Bacteroidales bacterium]